ncbi:cilia- and flagella-associated protein 58-like [Mya arenaria]|uniref:cilia- and flagella-associated protein 58-like n=1 Tax=Mya arenaria TaxID=6604 RepID=UPI0022E13289|nr:cilia- and flagella-associated protein 58-like [Mya arenaria]
MDSVELFLFILIWVCTLCFFTWIKSPKEAKPSSTDSKDTESDLPKMVPTEEEQQMFRDDNINPRVTVLINDTKRIEEDIKARTEEKIQLFKRIQGQEENLLRARENETKLKEKIQELEKECTELRKSGNNFYDTLAAKANELRRKREELEALQNQIECKDKALRESEEELRLKERALKESKLELSNLKEDLDEELKVQVQRYNRQEVTIQQLKKENWSQGVTIERLKEENLRYMEGTANKQDEYCRLHWWEDLHVSLETPNGTYISIHPPHNTMFPTIVNSLKEDIKHLQKIPNSSIPLFGLNVDAIDEWYNTIDINHELLSGDYRMVATALTKGSMVFENEFADFNDVEYTNQNVIIAWAANEYAKQQFSLTTV